MRRVRWRPLLPGLAVLGCVALALLAANRAATTVHSPIRPPGRWGDALSAAVVAAFALYLVGAVALRRRGAPVIGVLALAAAIQLAPLAGPLLLSTDVYSYWDYGRIAAVHHANPYDVRPSRFPLDPAYPWVGEDWQGKRTVYGPVWTLGSIGHAKLAGETAHTAQLIYRALAALAMVALVALVAVAAPRPAFGAALVGWNPLFAFHFAGGGHNDVLAAVLLVAGIAAGAAGRRETEGAGWALASAVKIFPLVLLPLRLLEQRRRFGWRGLLGTGLAIAAVSFASFSWQWLTIFSPVANQLRSTSSLGLAYHLSLHGIPERYARDGLLLLFLASYAWLAWQAWHGRARLALCACLLLLATSWLQPWYAVWALPLAALEEDSLATVLAVALSAYFLRDAIPL